MIGWIPTTMLDLKTKSFSFRSFPPLRLSKVPIAVEYIKDSVKYFNFHDILFWNCLNVEKHPQVEEYHVSIQKSKIREKNLSSMV